jgi:hypothetical protein
MPMQWTPAVLAPVAVSRYIGYYAHRQFLLVVFE